MPTSPSTTMPRHFEQEARNRVRRMPTRGSYSRDEIYPIVDQAMICHVGIVQDGQPFVIPTLHARRGDEILLHGASTSRLMRYVQEGNPVCITVTHTDGIVLARSVFHHSINYRSAVLFGTGYLVTGDEAKNEALKAFTDRIMPGRWDDARLPTAVELKATSVVAVTIESASAKVRVGPPGDDDEDYALPVWAGVVPLAEHAGTPIADPKLTEGIAVPDYITAYVEGK